MDQNILFALILGAVGVALAIMGLILGLVAKMSASRVAREMEEYRNEAAQETSSEWMLDQELAKILKRRQAMYNSVQRVKDQISTMLYAKHGNLNKEAAYKGVSDAGRSFSSMCDTHASKFTQNEMTALLRAKEAAIAATSQIRSFMDDIKDPADLSSSNRDGLMKMRFELSEAQLVLREFTQQQLIKRIMNELEGQD